MRAAWIKSHPERRKGVIEYTAEDCRIALADIFAGATSDEATFSKLSSPKFQRCKFGLRPLAHFKVSAKEVLEGMLCPGDFYWSDSGGCPLTGNLSMPSDEDIDEYFTDREKYARGHSDTPWTTCVTPLLQHIWSRQKYLRKGYRLFGGIQNVWDKRPHLRNLAKFL